MQNGEESIEASRDKVVQCKREQLCSRTLQQGTEIDPITLEA